MQKKDDEVSVVFLVMGVWVIMYTLLFVIKV